MNIESARYTVDALELMIDGHLAYVDTKKSLLDAGIAVLIDPDPADPHWATTTTATLEADPADGRPEPLVIPGGTREARIVDLALAYWEAANSDSFREGGVSV